jgi:hypothetical protein
LNQDGPDNSVYAQRYNAAGTPQGPEFRVNTYTTGSQLDPAAAMDANGDFVVVWTSNNQDGSGSGTFAQRYNATGTAQGAEFRVNTYTTSNQTVPAVAMDADGDFVVVWNSSGQDGSSDGIYAQFYTALGTSQGGEFRVNTNTTGNQRFPAVGMDADGDFVVAWNGPGTAESSDGVYAQRYLNNSLPTTSGIADVNVVVNSANWIINLWTAFADEEDSDSALIYSVESNTNPALFTSTNINPATGQLTLDFAPNAFGLAVVTIRATDTAGEFVEVTFTVTVLNPGDYNRDGSVDAADYVVWRKTRGATGLPTFSGADGDGDGDVDSNDLAVWKANYGETSAPPGAGSGALVASSPSTSRQLPRHSAIASIATTDVSHHAADHFFTLVGRNGWRRPWWKPPRA